MKVLKEIISILTVGDAVRLVMSAAGIIAVLYSVDAKPVQNTTALDAALEQFGGAKTVNRSIAQE